MRKWAGGFVERANYCFSKVTQIQQLFDIEIAQLAQPCATSASCCGWNNLVNRAGNKYLCVFRNGLSVRRSLKDLFICLEVHLDTHTHTHTVHSSDGWKTKLWYAPHFSVLLPEPWYITLEPWTICSVFSFVVTPAVEKQEAGTPEWEQPTTLSSFRKVLNPTATPTHGAACSQKYVELPKPSELGLTPPETNK